MINEEVLEKLCQSIINDDKITTKTLKKFNLNYLDIKKMLSLNILKKEKKGIYNFISSDYLLKYAKTLISKKEYQSAAIILEKSLILSPNNEEIISMLLYVSLELKNNKRAVELCQILKNKEDYKNKVNYYLSLLCLTTNIPKEDKDRLITEPNTIIPFHDLITEKLHQNIFEYEEDSILILSDFFKNNDYLGLKKALIEKEKNNGLNIFEEYILKLLYILSSRNINNINNEIKESNIFTEIDNGNYQKALKRTIEYSEDYFIYHVKCLNKILTKIDKLITKSNQIKLAKANYEEYVKTFPGVMKSLASRDINLILSSIESYLSSIGLNNYYPLMLNLIKLSLISGNSNLLGPISILFSISNKTYKFNISVYLKKFYSALTRKDFEKAKMYLNIISSASKIDIEFPMLQGLYGYLTEKEDKEEFKEKEDILTRINKKEQLTEYILQLREALIQEKGIIVLKSMKQEEINLVLKIIKKWENIGAFTISCNGVKRIVLKYQENSNQINIEEKFSEANEAYENKEYLKAINLYRELLHYSNDKTIFRRLGTSYMALYENKLALDYLTVAYYLEKNKQAKAEYMNLILTLTKKDKIEDKNNEDYNYCSETDFDIVNDYILKTGLDVESACQELNMTPYQTNTIKLYYAREFFIQRCPKKGEEFLKSFTASKDKSKQGKKMYNKIQKSKKVSSNRKSIKVRQLVYSIMPNK